MRDAKALAAWLYLANASVLITHEIDSAYWREWALFGLPGGLQLFLILNLLLVVLVLYGLTQVFLWQRRAAAFSYLLAGTGFFAFSIHLFFIIRGHPEFRLPVSLGLLLATLVLSAMQIFVVSKLNEE
jgi:hypothetical protein